MTAGVGVFATCSGSVAAWFLASKEKETATELDALHRELREIRQLLQARDGE